MRTRPNGLYTYPRGGTAGRLAFAAYLALTLACGGGALLLLAAFTALKPSSPEPAPPRSIPPSKIASVDTFSLTRTAWADIATPTPMIVPRASQPPQIPASLPTVAPTPVPTLWLIVPANPTPIPTPELPPAAPFPDSCDGPGRMNILLIGLDGRNSAYQRPARSDAIAVLGVNVGDKTAHLLSIPRDLWVPLPGLPENQRPEGKINTAYVWGEVDKLPGGGPGYLETVISSTFNLRIDRFAVINFGAFENAVDTIGGIDVDVPKAIHDTRYPAGDGVTMVVDIPAGPVHMDGATALIYARTRHQDGDFARMRRQQQVLMAIRDKLLSPEALPYLPALAEALYNTVYTDLTLDDMGLLGCVAPQINREAILNTAIDGTRVYSWKAPDGEAALQPKMDKIQPVLEEFNTGQ